MRLYYPCIRNGYLITRTELNYTLQDINSFGARTAVKLTQLYNIQLVNFKTNSR